MAGSLEQLARTTRLDQRWKLPQLEQKMADRHLQSLKELPMELEFLG
jgi:hypothetical protein